MEKRPRPKRQGQAGRVGNAHGRSWLSDDWCVPFIDGSAIFYHGHTDTSDHSNCGPQLYCCEVAARMFLRILPNAAAREADWELTSGLHLAQWLGGRGPTIFYFFFCDPDDRMQLRFACVRSPEVREVLLKQRSLDFCLNHADRLTLPNDHDDAPE